MSSDDADEVLVRCLGFAPADLALPPLTEAERNAYTAKPVAMLGGHGSATVRQARAGARPRLAYSRPVAMSDLA